MKIDVIKVVASDCQSTHRYAIVKPDCQENVFHQMRIVGIGRKYVRLMQANGRISLFPPASIVKVW